MSFSNTVSTEAQLNADIVTMDTTIGGYGPITLTASFTLTTELDVIKLANGGTLSIVGNGETIDGGGQFRGLFVLNGTVDIQDLTIQNAVALGGAGGAGFVGGGGGAGLGGGLFVAGTNVVNGATYAGGDVTLSNVVFSDNAAVGGAGGGLRTASGGGGGGGLGGDGGSTGGAGAGGGGIGIGATGGMPPSGSGGPGTIVPGGASAGDGDDEGPHYKGGAGGAAGGGGGAGASSIYAKGAGGGGGLGGGSVFLDVGGAGGFGGGGGGAWYTNTSTEAYRGYGGAGGFGGGGGGGGVSGKGGFGGGGSGGVGQSGAGGFGAGSGGGAASGGAEVKGGGGGGLGAGGDIFVQSGGILAIGAGTLSGSSVTGGAAGASQTGARAATAGSGLGSGIFLQGNTGSSQSVTFAPALGQTLTIADGIADQNNGAGRILMSGAGTVVLQAANSFTGAITIQSGTVQLATGGSLAATDAVAVNGGTFDVTGQTQTIGDLSGTGGAILLGSGTLTAGTKNSTTFAAAITGTGVLIKQGTGTLTLAGADALAGATITAGTLQIGNGGITCDISIASGAVLAVNESGVVTLGGVLSGAGQLVQSGTGTLTLTGADSFSTGTVSAGTLQLGDGGTIGGITGDISIAGGAVLAIDESGTVTLGGSISGAGSLVDTGTGTVVLTGTESFASATVSAGRLQIGDGGTTGGITGGISIASGAVLAVNESGTVTLGGVLSGAGRLVQSGTGTLTLTGSDSFSSGTVTHGTLQLGDGGMIGGITGAISIASGAVLAIDRTGTVTLGGSISGAGSLIDIGTGTVVLTGTDSFASATVNAGTLLLGAGAALPRDLALAVNKGKFALGGLNLEVGDLSGTGGTINLGGGMLMEGIGHTTTLAAAITGQGTFAQASGTLAAKGTLVMTGNDAASVNVINAGMVQLGDGGTTGSMTGDVDIVFGATLAIDRTDIVALDGSISGHGALINSGTGTVVLTGTDDLGFATVSAGTLQLGNGGTTGSLTGGIISIASGAVFAVNESGAVTLGGDLSGAGRLVQSGTGTLTLTGSDSFASATISAGTLQIGTGGTAGAITGGIMGGISIASGAVLAIDESGTVTLGGSISGAGSLIDSGTGTVVLQAANSFTGGTTIQSGTVQLATGGSLAATGAVAVKGGTLDVTGHTQTVGDLSGTGGAILLGSGTLIAGTTKSTTLAAAITGTGVLIKQGTGTLTLAGADALTGATITAGTLLLGASRALPSGLALAVNNGTVALSGLSLTVGDLSGTGGAINLGGGTLTEGIGDTTTLAAAITGPGTFVTQGTGTLVMTGTDAASVNMISAGVVQLGDGGDAGSMTGDVGIASGAVLAIDEGTTVTLGGSISGAGSLIDIGAGPVVLTGTDSFASATISAGTLRIGNGITTGGFTGDISLASGTDLVIDEGGTVTLGGSISGAGFLIDDGPGAVVVTGTDSFTSAIVGEGTLQIGNGGTTGGITGGISIASGAVLAVNESGAVNLGGVLSGAGRLVQLGIGTLTLTEADSFSSGTVSAGTLQIGDGGTIGGITGRISIASGAVLAIDESGTVTLGGSISGAGILSQTGSGTALLTAKDNWTGGATIHAGTLEIASGATAGSGTISFASDAATLRIDAATAPANVISGFVAGDAINLHGIAYNAADTLQYTVSTGILTILNGTSTVAQLAFGAGNAIVNDPFHIGEETSGTGIVITNDAPCFVQGTRVLSDHGEVAVEALRAGDRVMTVSADGDLIARCVRWIGRRRIDLTRHPNRSRVQPIRVARDAIGRGLPCRDLLLSPDHALFIDGMLIEAKSLVNGTTIRRDDAIASVVYFHIELGLHAVLLAEGLPAESYLDTGNRRMFDNGATSIQLHTDFSPANDQARRIAESCAPFAAEHARELIWHRIAARAVALGLPPPAPAACTADPDLHVVIDDQRIDAARTMPGRFLFLLPPSDGAITLASRSARPRDARPWVDDERQLGIMVKALRLSFGGVSATMELDHPALEAGWWDPEWHGAMSSRRWTDGRAAISVPPGARAWLEVEIDADGPLVYPLEDAATEATRHAAASVEARRAVHAADQ